VTEKDDQPDKARRQLFRPRPGESTEDMAKRIREATSAAVKAKRSPSASDFDHIDQRYYSFVEVDRLEGLFRVTWVQNKTWGVAMPLTCELFQADEWVESPQLERHLGPGGDEITEVGADRIAEVTSGG